MTKCAVDPDRELLFEILFWQEQREIRKMTEADNLKGSKNTEQTPLEER